MWLCTEKLLLHVSPRGLSILGLLLRALLKGGRKRLVLLKKIMGGELDSIGNGVWGGQENKLGVVFK